MEHQARAKTPFFSKKLLIMLIVSSTIVVAAGVFLVTALLPPRLSSHERQATRHLEELLQTLETPETFQLLGDVVTLGIHDQNAGRLDFAFITRRAVGTFGIRQRATAVFVNGTLLAYVEGPYVPDPDDVLSDQQQLWLALARREWATFVRNEGEPEPDWLNFRVINGERVAQHLELDWAQP